MFAIAGVEIDYGRRDVAMIAVTNFSAWAGSTKPCWFEGNPKVTYIDTDELYSLLLDNSLVPAPTWFQERYGYA